MAGGGFKEAGFEQGPQLEEFFDFFYGQFRDDRPSVGVDLYEAFCLELHQGLADRDPADAELSCKSILPQLKACWKPAIDDSSAKFLSDGGGDRSMPDGFLSRPRSGGGFDRHGVLRMAQLNCIDNSIAAAFCLTLKILYNLHFRCYCPVGGPREWRRELAGRVFFRR